MVLYIRERIVNPDVVHIVGVGVMDRARYELARQLAEEKRELPVTPGYPQSEIYRQRQLFGN